MKTTDRYLVQIDPSKRLTPQQSSTIIQFRTRKEAERGALRVGWSVCDATQVDIMGFAIWTLTDPHNNALTRDGFIALSR